MYILDSTSDWIRSKAFEADRQLLMSQVATINSWHELYYWAKEFFILINNNNNNINASIYWNLDRGHKLQWF